MLENEKRIIAHCIRQGYFSAEQFQTIEQKQARLAHAGYPQKMWNLVCKELRWSTETIDTIIREDSAGKAVAERDLSESFLPQIKSSPNRKSAKRRAYPSAGASVRDGRPFGEYILTEKLGSGGMGEVFKAYHPLLERDFALKMILPSKVGQESLRRFQREVQVTCRLNHPDIVRMHHVGRHKGMLYLVMDYIEGPELRRLISQKRFWPRRALEIILHIAWALAYSHAQGIIHRDIKPSNILIARDENGETPYLMDFGLAGVVKEEGLTRTGQIMGTPRYMSPEQAMGQSSRALSGSNSALRMQSSKSG